MFKRLILFVFVVCISTSVYAKDVATEAALIKDTYKTQDILLLFKSCYETLYFLGNTKYKGTRKPLTEEKVSKQ